MGLGKRGLPVSLHIMGPPGHDAQVLDTALKIEQLLDWKQPSFSVEDIASGGYTHSPSRLDTAGPLAAGISPYIPVV